MMKAVERGRGDKYSESGKWRRRKGRGKGK
jgi:hypothetical protein